MPRRRVAEDAPSPAQEAKLVPAATPKLPRPRLIDSGMQTPEELDAHQINERVGKAKAKHGCKCPNCSYRFIFKQDAAMPERLACPGCYREFDIERFVNEEQKFDPTFGAEVVCGNTINGKPCGQKFRAKAQGAGGADPERGTGGYERACPKCGAHQSANRRVGIAREGLQEDFDASSLPKR